MLGDHRNQEFWSHEITGKLRGELSPTSFWTLFLSMGLTQISGRSGGSIPQQTSGWAFSWFLKQTEQSFYVLFLRDLPKAKKISYVSRQNRFLCQNRTVNKIIIVLPPPPSTYFSIEKCQIIYLFGCNMRFLMSLGKTTLFLIYFSFWRFSTEHILTIF